MLTRPRSISSLLHWTSLRSAAVGRVVRNYQFDPNCEATMAANEDIEYTDEHISKLEAAFGKGFLSPGGDEEVEKIIVALT